MYRVPAQTIDQIIPETCQAIVEEIQDEYTKVHQYNDCVSVNLYIHADSYTKTADYFKYVSAHGEVFASDGCELEYGE